MKPLADRLYRPILAFACAGFLVALALFAYTGSFARYWADDYCYNKTLNAEGFWRAQVTFYQETSDRYSVIPLVGASELFGTAFIRVWPAVAVALLTLGLYFMLSCLSRAASLGLARLERALLALMSAFFTLWQAPNLFQVLYWRTGMLTYLMPLIFCLFLAGLLVDGARRAAHSPWHILLMALLAFAAGGFSETTTALQAGALGLAVLAAWIGERKGWLPRGRAWVLPLAALAGTLLAMVVLVLSPSVRLRMVHMPQSASLPQLIFLSIRFALAFVYHTIKGQVVPTLVSILAPLAFGMAWWGRRGPGRLPAVRRCAVAIAAAALVTFALIACSIAPSAYVEVAYPEPRAQIAPRLVLVLGLAFGALAAAPLALRLLARLRAPASFRSMALAGLLGLALLSLYPLRAGQSIVAEQAPYYSRRAAEWDARDAKIRRAVDSGSDQITATALDSIQGLMEIQPDRDHWVNTCMAGYYRVKTITGVNP